MGACCSSSNPETGLSTHSVVPSPKAERPHQSNVITVNKSDEMVENIDSGEVIDSAAKFKFQIDALTRLNLEMQAQLAAFSAQNSALMHSKPLIKKGSFLSNGKQVPIEPEELRTMRAIFELFDKDNSGYIEIAELRELHTRLGEPITEAEAQNVMKMMQKHGTDPSKGLDFDTFALLWTEEHDPEDSPHGKRYTQRFKFLKSKLRNPEVAKFYCKEEGAHPSLEYRVHFFYDHNKSSNRTAVTPEDEPPVYLPVHISPWHDIPLRNPDSSFNFICEIPKWTRKKFEIATGEPYNPIKQDTKNGVLREYAWGDMLFNYGAFPQTWEDPDHISLETGARGDNDPLDVVEIGSKQWSTGSIVSVKVLGVLGMIDSGETDWKVVTISTDDPLAKVLNGVNDVRAYLPGALEALHSWLMLYKSPSINKFAFDGQYKDREFALRIIEETHEFWRQLVDARGMAATV